jgi:hypothetical protein
MNLRRMISRQTRHWARTPIGEICIGARNYAVTIVAWLLFIVPQTTTSTKIHHISGSVLEAQTARAAA